MNLGAWARGAAHRILPRVTPWMLSRMTLLCGIRSRVSRGGKMSKTHRCLWKLVFPRPSPPAGVFWLAPLRGIVLIVC